MKIKYKKYEKYLVIFICFIFKEFNVLIYFLRLIFDNLYFINISEVNVIVFFCRFFYIFIEKYFIKLSFNLLYF